MVAKISLGSSLYGALAYNGEKINRNEGKLLATHRIYNDGSGTVDICRAVEDFRMFMPTNVRTEKPVLHISLNPHPEDRLSDTDLAEMAREYLDRLGYGNQPYMVYKHEDIDRHHLHIVTVNVDETGRRLNQDFLFRRSNRIRKELEEKYGLHKAEGRRSRLDSPIRKVDISAGDVKRQVANTVKGLLASYRFQSMGEYRALLSLYNISVEEPRGTVAGREYHGLVYSATDDAGNKVGNPFKSSRIGKDTGHEALERHFARSKAHINEKRLADMTRRTILAALRQTCHKEDFVRILHGKGVDTVFRFTDTGRIYGTTFIDHRTGCVLNGSRMGKELSANALQGHFTLPYAGEAPIQFTLPAGNIQPNEGLNLTEYEWENPSGLGLLSGETSSAEAQEEAFARSLRKKKKRKKQQNI